MSSTSNESQPVLTFTALVLLAVAISSATTQRPPDPAAFKAGSSRAEKSSGNVRLVIRVLPTEASLESWVEITATAEAGFTIRSVDLDFLRDGRIFDTQRSHEPPFRFVTAWNEMAMVSARVTLGTPAGGRDRTVRVMLQAPAPPSGSTSIGAGIPPASHPRAGAVPRSAPRAVAGAVEFEVRVSRIELPGAMDTGMDTFRCHALGPKEVLARVRRIEYLLVDPVEVPSGNAYYYEGVMEASKWPLTARIHWTDGHVTTQRIPRP